MTDLPPPPFNEADDQFPTPSGEVPAFTFGAQPTTELPIRQMFGPVTPPPSQRPLIATGLAVAVGLASLAFVVGRATAPSPDQVVPVSTSAPVAVETVEIPSTTIAPIETVDVAPVDPIIIQIPSDVEPVAAVAELVGPAVVQIETSSGVGSGVIYDSDGLILTAAHVVNGAQMVLVRLADGTSTEGTVVGTHDATDVAVVSISGRTNLPTAELAVGVDSSIGSLAVALGSPFGLDQTVTAGVISAFRTIGGVSMVQTDASINPGNSGGPLVDRLGRVIGINDQIFTQSGGNEGVGFAIAIDLAALVADQLVADEQVQLARLGVSSTTPSNGSAGALVQDVVVGSAAADAGLQVGDIIIGIGELSLQDSGDLRGAIISMLPGTSVDLVVVRNGSTVTVAVVLGAASF